MEHEQSKDVVLAESIFTPVMDVKQAVQGFKDFQKLKMEILDESDIVIIQGKPHVKKSGWNKLAMFFGACTKTISSKKTFNPDGSYEWEVTVEAYKKNRDGEEIYNVQRSALVSSLEKEKTENMKNSPRKSHDVFASAETRAEGRALAAFFGTGEVSAEEMEEMPAKPETKTVTQSDVCHCDFEKIKLSPDGKGCLNCKKALTEAQIKKVKAMYA